MRITKTPEERRQEIIAAARELFEKHGITGTKTSDIVKKVGVSQGLFYYYFKSKDEIVSAVMEQIIAETEAAGNQILKNGNIDFYQKTLQYFRFYNMVMERLERFVGSTKRAPSILSTDIVNKAEEQMMRQMKQLVMVGIEEGVLKLRYPEEMVLVLYYGLAGLRNHPIRWDDPDMELTIIEQVLTLPAGSLTEAKID